MAEAATLKAKVQSRLDRLRRERASAAAMYADELVRMDAQIAASERVLAAWDGRTDAMIAYLTDAGIQIQ